MPPTLMQWNFTVHNLIGGDINVPKKFWLKKGEILLKQEGNYLKACILTAQDESGFDVNKKILPYLKTCSLISNTPTLEGGGGQSIEKKSDLGREIRIVMTAELRTEYPKSAKRRIQKHVETYLNQIKTLQKKYYPEVERNPFLETCLDYYYNSRVKSTSQNEGFVNAMMSLEALFNEGAGDITYKLQQRTSFVLGLCKFEPSRIFEQFKEFYKLRNAVVHGGEAIPRVENRHNVVHYARMSLIVFLILCRNHRRKLIGRDKRKKEILNEIDKAMLDVSKRHSLENEIKRGLQDFKLKVPRKFEGKTNGRLYRVFPW